MLVFEVEQNNEGRVLKDIKKADKTLYFISLMKPNKKI